MPYHHSIEHQFFSATRSVRNPGHLRRTVDLGMTSASTARAVGLTALMTVVGCSSSATVSAESSESPQCGCIERVPSVPDGYTSVLGAVALPTEDTHRRGRPGPENDPDLAMRFSKMGLLVREGAEFSIDVSAASQPNALVDWPLPMDRIPGTRISSGGCEASSATWLVFAGGVWTREPACVTLSLEANGDTAEFMLPIGTPCGEN